MYPYAYTQTQKQTQTQTQTQAQAQAQAQAQTQTRERVQNPQKQHKQTTVFSVCARKRVYACVCARAQGRERKGDSGRATTPLWHPLPLPPALTPHFVSSSLQSSLKPLSILLSVMHLAPLIPPTHKHTHTHTHTHMQMQMHIRTYTYRASRTLVLVEIVPRLTVTVTHDITNTRQEHVRNPCQSESCLRNQEPYMDLSKW